MKHRLFVLLWACSFYLLMGAKPKPMPDKAALLNAQVDELLARLAAPTDSDTYYLTLANAILLAMECDRADAPGYRFRQQNIARLLPLRADLLAKIQATPIQTELRKRLVNVFIESSSSPLFRSQSVDLGAMLLRVAALHYDAALYKEAEYYADKAMLFQHSAESAAEWKVKYMEKQLKAQSDSAMFILTLLNLHKINPKNQLFLGLIIDHLSRSGREAALASFAREELVQDSTNIRAWLIVGELSMNQKDWDEAIKAYREVEKLDSVLTLPLYNLGICYSSKALEMREQLADSKGRLTPRLRNEVKKVLQQSKRYLELVRQQDPAADAIDWRKPLYLVYYALHERDKAREIKKIMNQDK